MPLALAAAGSCALGGGGAEKKVGDVYLWITVT